MSAAGPMDPAAPAGSPLRAAAWLALPAALGAALRLRGLSRQVFLGDEQHGVRAALDLPLGEILTTYRLADHCIPLSAFYRVLMESGVALSEPLLRLPAVLPGLALLVLLPLGVARWPAPGGGWRRGAVLAWLLAISPVLVFYSRFARPYAVVALLSPLAAAAFWRWWRGRPGRPGRGHGWAVLYAGGGAASVWFHLGTLPFVAAPLVWGAADLARARLGRGRRAPGRGLAGLAAVAAGLAAGLAAFLLPALPSLRRLVRVKATAARADLGTLGDVALLQAGTSQPVLAALFWGLAALGLAALLRRRPDLGLYSVLLVAIQWAAMVLILRPAAVHLPVALNRYVLATLPIVLLWVAEGICRLGDALRERGRAGGWAAAGVTAGALCAFGLGGPYAADPAFRLGPFAGTWQTLGIERESPALPPALVPAAFHQIAAEPGDEPVVHLVARLAASALGPDTALARSHRRRVILAAPFPYLKDPRLGLRTVTFADPERIAASGGRFVILLLDTPYWRRLGRTLKEGLPAPGPTPPHQGDVVRARELAEVLRAAWGEPHLVSAGVLVWDLARVGPG